MHIAKNNKLQNLLEHWVSGQVATTPWLESLSISRQLTWRYLQSGWIESFGHGAYKKKNDKISCYAGISAAQQQLGMNVHIGAGTALAMKGYSHYIRFGKEKIYAFSHLNQKLPKWLREHEWENPVEFVKTSFLPENLGVEEFDFNGLNVKTSSPERAILECLYLSPNNFDLLESYQITEGLTTLRPDLLQELLEQCSCVRAKRLFLYMADKANLPVLKYLKLDKVNLGKGARAIVNNGTYDSKYQISLSEELVNYV